MCGIAGLIALGAIPDLAAKLEAMSQTQAHRGPDDLGFLTWDGNGNPDLGREPAKLRPGRLGLVHRRLSIFDLSPLGWQPMSGKGGRQAIVFNGEIYNYPELKAELEEGGHRFASTSDTEVLLAILARDGLDGLKRLVGMYAFAYVDFDQRSLMLARDPFGIKPLHYSLANGVLGFASTIAPLLAVGAAGRTADKAALFRYLRHAVTNYGGATVFADVAELEPGSVMEVALDRPLEPRVLRFWQPRRPPVPRRVSPPDAAAELRDILTRNVALHMRADVPLAAALSGGVDSSAIACLMRRHLGQDAALDVFTYVADSERLSERRWAGIVAETTAARVHEVRLSPETMGDEIDDLIRHQEQPFNTTSMWAQAHVYRTARAAGFKIVLDGQGADETLAGYPVFRAARLEGLIRRGRLREAGEMMRQMPAPRRAALMQRPVGCCRGRPVASRVRPSDVL